MDTNGIPCHSGQHFVQVDASSQKKKSIITEPNVRTIDNALWIHSLGGRHVGSIKVKR